jgi:hypothetical protein
MPLVADAQYVAVAMILNGFTAEISPRNRFGYHTPDMNTNRKPGTD